jgi:carbon dioxide concentrating mechanism protein CcmO
MRDAGALGVLEVGSFTAAMVAVDAMEKTAGVEVLQAELNDLMGVSIRVSGETAAVAAALAAAAEVGQRMQTRVVHDLIANPDPRGRPAWSAQPEYNLLIEQNVVHFPGQSAKERTVSEQENFAIGMIETQGFTAVIEAIDTACKAASVEVIGREKLGGGYITVLIKGDTAAVKAAIEAGRGKVEGLGKLIATHVIPRPSRQVLGLLAAMK